MTHSFLLDKKSGLSGGSLAAVMIVVMLFLGVVLLIGLLWWKKRHPNKESHQGIDNALYHKDEEKVNLDRESSNP